MAEVIVKPRAVTVIGEVPDKDLLKEIKHRVGPGEAVVVVPREMLEEALGRPKKYKGLVPGDR